MCVFDFSFVAGSNARAEQVLLRCRQEKAAADRFKQLLLSAQSQAGEQETEAAEVA